MPNREHELQPQGITPELADVLKRQKYACMTVSTDQGTALFIKAPASEIRRIPSPVPIRLQHFLYEFPSAPVIRMLITIYDVPAHPLAMDLFVNVEDEQARGDYAALADQAEVPFLFHDEQLRRQRAITVRNGDHEQIREIVAGADRVLAGIPKESFDFMLAKAAVVRRTTMRDL